MNYWIIPCDPEYYDCEASFRKNGVIDWRDSFRPNVNDIVYIYYSLPLSCIKFKCVVTKNNLRPNEVINDLQFYRKGIDPQKDLNFKIKNRIKFISELPDNRTLSYKVLKQLGIKASLQGPIRNLTKEQIDYIDSCFDKPGNIQFVPQSSDNKYQEGAVIEEISKRYERDPRNRIACIDYYGTTCQVCGMDLGDVYGEVGKGYIEVHHLIPLSKVQHSHQPDPVKEMIPVCPNCHSMIHAADRKGYDVSSLDKIKKVLFK